MTFAESVVMLRGYFLNRDYRSADFRALYGLTFNINSKSKKTVTQLWPLDIDNKLFGKQPTHEELAARNKIIRDL